MAKRRRTEYPRFVQDDDVLIRIGWDDYSEREYVIRKTPKYAIKMLVTRILENCDPDGNFIWQELPNLTDPEFGDISEREIQLCLQWLVSTRLVRKFSNGHLVSSGVDLLNEVETHWSRIPQPSLPNDDT